MRRLPQNWGSGGCRHWRWPQPGASSAVRGQVGWNSRIRLVPRVSDGEAFRGPGMRIPAMSFGCRAETKATVHAMANVLRISATAKRGHQTWGHHNEAGADDREADEHTGRRRTAQPFPTCRPRGCRSRPHPLSCRSGQCVAILHEAGAVGDAVVESHRVAVRLVRQPIHARADRLWLPARARSAQAGTP
jgi:hypothetical protein